MALTLFNQLAHEAGWAIDWTAIDPYVFAHACTVAIVRDEAGIEALLSRPATGDLAVDSYTAEIDDSTIVEFVQGRTDGSAEFNPGFKPLKVGSTEVTMTNEQGGIRPLTFTIEVTQIPAGSNLGGAGR